MLFVCEVDNLSYSIGLKENLRNRIEGAGRIELASTEQDALMRLKLVHIPTIMGGMIATLVLFAEEKHYGSGVMLPSFLASLAGGLAEAILEWIYTPDVTITQFIVKISKVFGSWVFAIFATMMIAGSMK